MQPYRKKVIKDFLEILNNNLIRKGKIINPKGSIKKGGNNRAVKIPRIKNLNKIN